MKRGRIASFTEIARICREARRHVLTLDGGRNGFASEPTNLFAEGQKQGLLRRISAESTKRLLAAGIHIEGA